MGFRYLPHTADIKLEAQGATLQEAFGEVAKAVTHIMTEESIKSVLSYPISLTAENKEALLFDFLDWLIILLDTEGLFVSNASLNITRTDKTWMLSGTVYGDEAAGYKRHGDVKAPTYHDMAIEQLKTGNWCVTAVLDI